MPSNYRNKSTVEYEKEFTYLVARDGQKCNQKNGHGCGRTFDELYLEEQRVRRMTGKTRKAPIVQIDHLNGDSHTRDGPNDEYCGNEQILCTPCHIRKTVSEKAQKAQIKLALTDKPRSMEMDKNVRSESDWLRQVVNYIHDNHSVCYSLARYGFPELSPVTTKRYVDKRLVSFDKDVDPMLEGGWGRCNSALCNGVHLYFYGNAPVQEEQER